MEVDVAIVVLLVAGFLLGYLRGAIRQLIVVGAWLVTFVASAYLREPVGDWIAANATDYSREHVEMLAFAVVFLVLFALAVLVIEMGGSTVHLTQRVAVDEVIGGVLALGATLLMIAALVIVLDTYYLANPSAGVPEFDFVSHLSLAFDRSTIVGFLHDSLIPGLISLLGPLLPADIRAVYA